mgnify:CR=1 FL=1
MNEHHSNRVIINVERKNDARKTFVRTIPDSINKQNFIGDLVDEYYYLMNEDQDRSIMFYDDVDGSIFICKRSDVLSIEISRS